MIGIVGRFGLRFWYWLGVDLRVCPSMLEIYIFFSRYMWRLLDLNLHLVSLDRLDTLSQDTVETFLQSLYDKPSCKGLIVLLFYSFFITLLGKYRISSFCLLDWVHLNKILKEMSLLTYLMLMKHRNNRLDESFMLQIAFNTGYIHIHGWFIAWLH